LIAEGRLAAGSITKRKEARLASGSTFMPEYRRSKLLLKAGHGVTHQCVTFGRTYWRTITLTLVVAGCVTQATAAPATCVVLAGTADGFTKQSAVSRALSALKDYIKQYRAENRLGAVTIRAKRAELQPYWRNRVSESMMYQPDIVTATSHTVCWQGVISFYVCTSGAEVCW
jgi:hypothetical protein